MERRTFSLVKGAMPGVCDSDAGSIRLIAVNYLKCNSKLESPRHQPAYETLPLFGVARRAAPERITCATHLVAAHLFVESRLDDVIVDALLGKFAGDAPSSVASADAASNPRGGEPSVVNQLYFTEPTDDAIDDASGISVVQQTLAQLRA
jgi:hypothetical protein